MKYNREALIALAYLARCHFERCQASPSGLTGQPWLIIEVGLHKDDLVETTSLPDWD